MRLKGLRYIGMSCLEIFYCDQRLRIKAKDIGVIGVLSQTLVAQLAGELGFSLPEVQHCLIKDCLRTLGLANGAPQRFFDLQNITLQLEDKSSVESQYLRTVTLVTQAGIPVL